MAKRETRLGAPRERYWVWIGERDSQGHRIYLCRHCNHRHPFHEDDCRVARQRDAYDKRAAEHENDGDIDFSRDPQFGSRLEEGFRMLRSSGNGEFEA